MITNYERYLILTGILVREDDLEQESRIMDLMDDVWNQLSQHQKKCARQISPYAVKLKERLGAKS